MIRLSVVDIKSLLGLGGLPVSPHFLYGDQQPPTKHYRLSCAHCNSVFDDDGYLFNCSKCQVPSLLKSNYNDGSLTIMPTEDGIYRYRNWLPIQQTVRGAAKSVTFQSAGISRLTGLNNLWISFNGYWPERGALLPTGSFKELEAYCVLGRTPLGVERILTVASAGNTAAAFAYACSENNIPALIFIPEQAISKMRFSVPIAPCVKIAVISGSGDYMDAIRAAEHITTVENFYPEGGVRNVARRDGLGTVLLNVFETIGSLPEYYFQAAGSGTGRLLSMRPRRNFQEQNKPYHTSISAKIILLIPFIDRGIQVQISG